MSRRRPVPLWRRLAATTAVVLLLGSGTAMAADSTPSALPDHGPSSRPAAGPENTAAAGARPVSGRNPSAGPQFVKSGSTWNVVAPEVVLRNTVTDPDGDDANLTFEVWTTDAAGKPKTQVNLTDENPYGVLVSDMVASGKAAQVTVDYGRLKPGVTYTFRTSAYDGSLYETEWSPWANFKINPYVTFPAPQASSTIDSLAQKAREVTRTMPGSVAAAQRARLKAEGKDDAAAKVTPKRSCSQADAQGRKLCIEITPPTKESKQRAAAANAAAADSTNPNLVDWCGSQTPGKDYMTRTEVCLKNLGTATLIFVDAEDMPAFGIATFDIQQQMKTYTKKADSGSDFAEFDQQLVVMPSSIDAALQGVTLKWRIDNNCGANCTTSQVKWVDNQNAPSTNHWDITEAGPLNARWGTVQTTWSGTGKQTIDLGWSIEASIDAANLTASADFGTSGDARVQELAPRCDDILSGVSPGCVLPFFKPTYTVDTNLFPAAGAYYWLMQEKMPDHAGSVKWDSLLHYLGPDTTVTHPDTGKPWTSSDSRGKVCPSSWTPHIADTRLGALGCDEYAMASTHESGGFPGGINQVTNGNQCAQLFADKLAGGSADYGLLADTRVAKKGPTWKEKCGRAAIPRTQNEGAFKKLQPSVWRLLDGDGFFVSNPGFEHCANATTTCAWRKIG